MSDEHTGRFRRLLDRVPLTLWVTVIVAVITAYSGYTLLQHRVATNELQIIEIKKLTADIRSMQVSIARIERQQDRLLFNR